jgi:hypothetical protein
MPDLSADRHAILEQLKQADDAERLLRGKSREQANWQPKQGTSWSMWQCFDHLARINRVYCQALRAAVENPREKRESQMIMPGWFSRWFTRSMGPPVRTRFTAPAKVIPTQAGDPEEALHVFLEFHAPVRRVLEFWDRVNFSSLQEPVRAAASFYHRHRTAGHQCA